jgi:hypothetical protein
MRDEDPILIFAFECLQAYFATQITLLLTAGCLAEQEAHLQSARHARYIALRNARAVTGGYSWPAWARSSALLLPPQPCFQVEAELSCGEADPPQDDPVTTHRGLAGGTELQERHLISNLRPRCGDSPAGIVGGDDVDSGHAHGNYDCDAATQCKLSATALYDTSPRSTSVGGSQAGERADSPTSCRLTVDRALIQVFLRSVLVPRDFLRTRACDSARAFENCSTGSAPFSR